MSARFLKILGSLALTAFVFYFLFTRFDIDFERLNFDLDWTLVVVASFFYYVALLLKAARFRFFLENKITLSQMFSIVASHSFWNNILPFRSGELSYLYLLRKHVAVGAGEGISSLVLARAFDALVVLIFFVFSASFLLPQALAFSPSLGASVGIGFVALVILGSGVVIFWNKAALNIFDFLSPMFLPQSILKKTIVKKIHEVLVSFSRVKSPKTFSHFFLFSVCVWIADMLFVWTALRAGGFMLHIQLLLVSLLFFCIARFMKPSEKSRTHTEFYATFENPEKDFRNANLSALLLEFATGKNILDIGSGNGLLLRLAKKKGFLVFGIEMDEKLVQLSKKYDPLVSVTTTTLEAYETKDKFDTVILEDVLECIKDDRLAIAKAVSLVKTGGRIIVSVPAYPWLFGSRDRMLGYFRRYNLGEISRHFEELGFSVVKRRYWNSLLLIPYFLLYKVLKNESHFEKIRGGSKEGFLKRLVSAIFRYWFKNIENKYNIGF